MSRPIQPQPPVQQPRRRRKAQIAGVMAAALVISWGGPAASAYWQTLGSNPATAKADSILGVAAPAASAAAGAASVSWAQSTTAAGRPLSGYIVDRYSSAIGGTKVAAGGACTGTITTLSCREAALPAGTWYYTVTPVLASWAGVESARSVGVTAADTTPPDAPTVNKPQPVNAVSAPIASVSGTAEAGSLVTVTVTDSATPQHSAVKTGSADALTGQWTISNFDLRGLTDGIVTYTATAKDAAGNISAPGSVQSTKDVMAPSVAVGGVVLSNGTGTQFLPDAGDKVVVTFSEPLLPASICGNWTSPSGSQSVNGTVQIAGGNALSFTSTDPGCPAVRFGSVALSGNYSAGGNLTFNSSLTWNPANSQLTITLGSLTGGSPTTKNGNVMPTYTPSSGLTDGAGNPLPVGAVAGANSKF